MTDSEKQAIDRRLARLEGQVRGVRRMVQEGDYCCDILQQIAAASSALSQIGAAVASAHIKGCVIGHGSSSAHDKTNSMTHEEMLEELDEVLSRLMKS